MFNFNWRRFSRLYIVLLALTLLAASFGLGVFYGYENRPGTEKVLGVIGKEPPAQEFKDVDFNLFWDVWSKLEEKYVDKDKIDRERLIYGAISGMVRALKDPYSEFLNPEISKQFQEDIRGSFGGIGAEIGIRRGVLTIIAPLKNTPAERAGLKPGDKILSVDDTPTAELALDEAVRLIRGPEGSEVRLTIFRDSSDGAKEIKIVRGIIKIEVLSTESKVAGGGGEGKEEIPLPEGVFLIKLNHFTENAAFEFRRAVQEFYSIGSRKLILDLRNNPGGFLQVAVDIASWWLPPGEVVVRERLADGGEELYRSNGYRLLESIPTVILVNEGSASASEIVAGALRDHKNIQLIGSKTFGKGSVQEVVQLPKGASLKITIARWLTPKGAELEGKGLEPDIKVEVTEENTKDGRDPVTEKAIEVLK